MENTLTYKELKLRQADKLYMDIARRFAEESKATRLKVGAILVKNNNIISTGWNGTPAGFSNICEDENNNTKPEVLHAEINLFAKLARDGGNALGATLYCTHSSCMNCSLFAISAQVDRLVYGTQYRDISGLEILQKAGIQLLHFTE